MADTDIDLAIKIKTEAAKKALRDLGGFSEAEIGRMTAGVAKGYKAQEKAALAAAKAFKATVMEVKGASQKIGAAVGGVFGGTTAQVLNLAEGLYGIAGPAGLAAAGLAGVALSGGVAYAAMDSLSDSTSKAIGTLAGLHGAQGPAEGAAEAVRAWDHATLQLDASMAHLTTVLGAEMLPAAAKTLEAVNGLVVGFTSAGEAMGAGSDAAYNFARGLAAVTSLGTSEALIYLRNSAAEVGGEVTKTKLSTKSFAETIGALGDASKTTTDLQHKGAAAVAEWGRAAEKAEKDAMEIRIAARAEESGREQERIDRDKANASRMEAELAASEDFLNRKAQFELDASNASIALAEAEAERKRAAIRMALGAVEAATQATIGLGIAALDQQIANAEGGSAAEQEAAMKAWKLRQALAITNAGIDGVSAYMGLLAGFAPLLWGAPIAAAAIAVPATATAISQIASAPAPTFPDGGMVRRPRMVSDHFPIGVEEGEGVANRRGIRNNPGVLDAMNSGARVGGGSVSIVNRYRHREFNAVTKDNLKMSSPLSRKLDGLSPPGRRR